MCQRPRSQTKTADSRLVTVRIELSDFLKWIVSPNIAKEIGVLAGMPLLVVEVSKSISAGISPETVAAIARLPCVVAAVAPDPDMIPAVFANAMDFVLIEGERAPDSTCVACGPSSQEQLSRLETNIRANPKAATAFALLLRQGQGNPIARLLAESATYSMLQAGSEFRSWRERTPVRPIGDMADARIRTVRNGDNFLITLTRPRRHNAYDSRMRDALDAALTEAEALQPDRIILSGEGPSFCSGGDLDEFGTAPDPVESHLVRIAANPTPRLLKLSHKLHAHVHGNCVGSGAEIAAFAHRVVADPLTHFSLPEIGMGLIPGAGGTVSITDRIGRHRTAFLALSGQQIPAAVALEWGLVDEIIEHPHKTYGNG